MGETGGVMSQTNNPRSFSTVPTVFCQKRKPNIPSVSRLDMTDNTVQNEEPKNEETLREIKKNCHSPNGTMNSKCTP